jgi:large subunit ribosomal protein L24
MKNLFKKGLKVKVCVGKDKGKTGEIIEINRFRNLAKVKDVNMQKKHKKATKENKGGIINKEGYVHLSNLKNTTELKKGKK